MVILKNGLNMAIFTRSHLFQSIILGTFAGDDIRTFIVRMILGDSTMVGDMKSPFISCIDSKMGLTVLRIQPLSVVNVPFQK